MRSGATLCSVLGLAAVVAAGACGGARSTSPSSATTPSVKLPVAASCGGPRSGHFAKRIGDAREGSPVVLAEVDGKTIAYVADEDDRVIHTVDLGKQVELSTTDLLGSPSQLLVTPDGRVVALLRDKGELQVLEASGKSDGSLVSRCTVETADEPIGIAASPDDKSIVVTSGWGHALTSYDAATLTRGFSVDLAREPRAVTVSDDNKKAFVSHVVGSRMSVVDLATHAVREIEVGAIDEGAATNAFPGGEIDFIEGRNSVPMPSARKGKSPPPPVQGLIAPKHMRLGCQGFALAKMVREPGKHEARILGPQVLVDPGQPEVRAQGYGSVAVDTEISSIVVVDPATEKPVPTANKVTSNNFPAQAIQRMAPTTKCLLPRAAAADGKTGTLYVTCLGIDELIAYDATAANPIAAQSREWKVAAGPVGVAVDGAHERVVVYSQFDRVLDLVPTPHGTIEEQMLKGADKAVVRLPLSRRAEAAAKGDVALGRKLFHAAGDSRISRDGRACASCHPDGRDDALTWATPDGPRQTPMLAGRLSKSAPFGWMGNGKEVEDHLTSTFQRLGGGGLQKNELEGLVAYLMTMRTPTTQHENALLVRRGSEIFHSPEAACGSCHVSGVTDGKTHDVKSAAQADGTHTTFDTPSLQFVGGTGPYFHDGRYATLRELLVKSDGKMGKTSHLSPADLDALEAYLKSL